MNDLGRLIADTALQYEGVKEAPGSANNEQVVAFHRAVDGNYQPDSVAWCASFVNFILATVGIPGTGSRLAQSFRKWGQRVEHADVQVGDIYVEPRGNVSWQGHTGIVVKVAADRVEIIAGNSSDQVKRETHYKSEAFPDGFRRAVMPRQSLLSSSTLQAAGVSGTAVVGGAASLMSALGPTERMVLIVAGLVILAGLAWIARERIVKWGRGVR